MAFIVEDGTGVTNANSYSSVEFADGYFSMRPANSWGTFTLENKQKYLVAATDYINIRFKYKSSRMFKTQELEFPRIMFGLPNDVLKACCEYALRASSGKLFVDESQGAKIKQTSVKVDVIAKSTTYDNESHTQNEFSVIHAADRLMKKYAHSGNNYYIQRG